MKQSAAHAPAQAGSPSIKRLLTRAIGYPLVALAALAGLLLALVSVVVAAPHGDAPGVTNVLLVVMAVVLAVAVGWLVAWSLREIARITEAYDGVLQAAAGQRATSGETETRLAAIIDSAMDVIITVDGSARVVVFNAMAERVFGWHAREMMGQPLDRLLPDRFRTAHASSVARFAATGETVRSMGVPGQLLAVRKSGDEFPIEATISQVTVGGERFMTVILRDIGPRIQAERALRESDERFRLLADGSREYALYFLDINGTVTNWNAGAERLTGYVARDVVGTSVERFFSDEDRRAGRLRQDLQLAGQHGSLSIDTIEVARGGRPFRCAVTLTALRGPGGALTGYARLVHDLERRPAATHAAQDAR